MIRSIHPMGRTKGHTMRHTRSGERPILVTGATRSGTTFVGRMLSLPTHVGLIYEPLAYYKGVEGIDIQFKHIYSGMEQEEKYAALIQQILDGDATFKSGRPSRNPVKRVAKRLIHNRLHLIYLWAVRNPLTTRLLIKDPFCSFASEYLHREFDMDVVVLVRHPAAYAASVQRMGWLYDLDWLRSQSCLRETYLRSVLDQELVREEDTVEVAALVWRCVYQVLSWYMARNPNMILLRHEDVSENPRDVFRALYERLNLNYTKRIDKKVHRFTQQSNPSAPKPGKIHTLKRNSRDIVHRWKKLLTPDQVQRVRDITADIPDVWYSDEDWSLDGR